VISEALTRPLLVVDACCWINLFATGHIEGIVTALRLVVSRYVAEEEVLSVLTVTGGEERCDFTKLRTTRLVSIRDIETLEEKRELVRFAAHLDDGEASVCALAVVCGGAVATDDRKSIRILGQLAPGVSVVQTPELLHEWAERAHPPRELLSVTLHAIQSRARFSPRSNVPFYPWWADCLGPGE
jgi:predicted nucleic acid-binding protein